MLVESVPSGLSVDGAVPKPSVTIPGPVWIADRRHDGDLRLEVRWSSGLHAVVRLPLETYVAGVVAAELPIWSAEPAELEAQAIAARTFAAAELLRRGEAGGRNELMDGVLDQAYRGTYDERGSKGAIEAGERLRAAVDRTRGLALLRGQAFEEARYHASCGGHTASFAEVFADEVRERGAHGSSGTSCAGCSARAAVEAQVGQPAKTRPLGWTYEVSRESLEELGRAIGLDGAPTRIASARFGAAGSESNRRWLEVILERGDQRVTVPFDRLRSEIGYGDLKSALILDTAPRPGASFDGASLTFRGLGRGHGVGLCQEGARDLARLGWSSDAILGHYYAGARVDRVEWATE